MEGASTDGSIVEMLPSVGGKMQVVNYKALLKELAKYNDYFCQWGELACDGVTNYYAAANWN